MIGSGISRHEANVCEVFGDKSLNMLVTVLTLIFSDVGGCFRERVETIRC